MELLYDQEYFGVQEYIIIYNTQIAEQRLRHSHQMDASTKARVTGATEATGSIGAKADESAIKVHKVTSTSSTFPCLHHYDFILRSKGQLLTHPCLTHSHGRGGGCTGPACTSQHPHTSSFTLHCSQNVLRGVSRT